MHHMIRWTSITSSNTHHVSRSGPIQDRAGHNLLEPNDNGFDIYRSPQSDEIVSSFIDVIQDLSLWMCNISTLPVSQGDDGARTTGAIRSPSIVA